MDLLGLAPLDTVELSVDAANAAGDLWPMVAWLVEPIVPTAGWPAPTNCSDSFAVIVAIITSITVVIAGSAADPSCLVLALISY